MTFDPKESRRLQAAAATLLPLTQKGRGFRFANSKGGFRRIPSPGEGQCSNTMQANADRDEAIAAYLVHACNVLPAALLEVEAYIGITSENGWNTGPTRDCSDCGRRMVWSHRDGRHLPTWMCPECCYQRMVRAEEAEKRLQAIEADRDAIQETLSFVEEAVGDVYPIITNGRFAKCNTDPTVILDEFNERLEEAEKDGAERLQRLINEWAAAREDDFAGRDTTERLLGAEAALLSAAQPPTGEAGG